MATNLPAGTPQAAGASLANSSLLSVGQASDELRNAFGRLGEGMKEFGRAAVSTSDSFSKYNTAIRGATIAASDIAKQFGAVGMAISAVIKIFGGLTTSVLAQNDALIKAKDQLNQVGFNSEMTAEQIGNMARQVGYTTKNLEEYIGVVRSVGTGLITMGKNAGEGSKAFMRLSAVGLDVQTNFAKVGISQTDLVKHQAHYVKLMQMTGLQVKDRAGNEKELQKASLEYVKNLLVISNLTGEEIEAVKARKEAVAAERHFMLQQAMLSDEAAELDRQGFKDEAAKKRKEIEANEMMAEMITRNLDSADQAGALQAMLTGSYTKLSSGLAATGEDYLGAFATMKEKLMRGSATSAEELGVFMKNASLRTMRQFGTSMMLNQDIRNQVHLSNKGIQVAGQRRADTEEEAAERLRQSRSQLEAALTGTADSIAQDRKIRQMAERQFATTLENLQRLAAGPVSTAFRIFMKGLELAGRGLFRIFEFFNKERAAEFEHMFVSSEEVPKRLTELADGIKGTEEAIAKQKKLIADTTGMPQTVAEYQERYRNLKIASTADEDIDSIVDMPEEQKRAARELADNARKELKRLEAHGKLMEQLDDYEKKLVILKRRQVFMEERRQMVEFERTGTAGEPAGGTAGGTAATGGTSSAASSGGVATMLNNPAEMAKQLNLRLKTGSNGALRDGAAVSSRVFDLAQAIQKNFGNIFITGLDDQFHQDKKPGSAHTRGLAMDFHFMDENQKEKAPKTAEEAAEMLSAFRGMGASNAIDHYFAHRAGIVGDGHYHVEVPGARFGISPRRIKAATSGQLMAVHDNEIVAPLDPNSIIAKLLTASPSEADAILGGRMNNDLADTFRSGFSELSSKVSELVAQMETLNSTEDQMLRYTRSA